MEDGQYDTIQLYSRYNSLFNIHHFAASFGETFEGGTNIKSVFFSSKEHMHGRRESYREYSFRTSPAQYHN